MKRQCHGQMKRPCHGQMKNDKVTNIDLQNQQRKIKIEQREHHKYSVVYSCALQPVPDLGQMRPCAS